MLETDFGGSPCPEWMVGGDFERYGLITTVNADLQTMRQDFAGLQQLRVFGLGFS